MAVPDMALQVRSSVALTPHRSTYPDACEHVAARIAPVEPQTSQQTPAEEQTCPGGPTL